MKVATKLFGAFLLVLLLMAGLGVYAIQSMATINGSTRDFATNWLWLPSVRAVVSIKSAVNRLRVLNYRGIAVTDALGIADNDRQSEQKLADIRKLIDVYVPLISSAEERQAYEVFKAAQVAEHTYEAARSLMIGALVACAVLALGMAFFITRSLSVRLREAVQAANRLADGDLTVRIESQSADEVGQLLQAMHNMVEKLSQVVGEVNSNAESLAGASEEVSATVQSLSQAASEQAAGVEETSVSLEQMTASIAQNTENAKVTDGMATQASREAAEGGEAVKATVAAMMQIAQKIGIIDDIAYQTNLLALNTAIEAARAGKLLDHMVPNIKKTSDLVPELTAASEEQSSGVGQIDAAVTQLSQTTQQNVSSSEELAATAEPMSGQAGQLQQTMAFFQLDSALARAAAGAARKPAVRPGQAHMPAKRAGPVPRKTERTRATGAAVPDEAQFAPF